MNAPPSVLLCATDFSPVGRAAVRAAYALAGPSTTVHLVHVLEPAGVLPTGPLDAVQGPWVEDPAEGAAREGRARAALRALVPDASLASGVRTRLAVRRGFGVASEVLEEARRVGADVVVIGTHGRSALVRALMGSVAAEVLRRAEVEVVLVRPPRSVAPRSAVAGAWRGPFADETPREFAADPGAPGAKRRV